jgi:hypothetical protein
MVVLSSWLSNNLASALLAMEGGKKNIEGVEVRSFPLNHPGGCFGYCFENGGRKIVYATDNEIEPQPGDVFPDSFNEGPLRQVSQNLVEILKF